MRAAWFRARSELRGRWKASVSLALLIGVGGGTILGTIAAARRTDSAYPRFVERYHGADIAVANFPDEGGQTLSANVVEPIPGASAIERIRFAMLNVGGDFVVGYVRSDASQRIDGYKVLEGRPPDPGRADEVVATLLGRQKGLRVGQTFDLATFEGDDGEFATFARAIAARPLRMRIVGVAAVPGGFPPQVGEVAPLAYLTPAFFRAYPNAFDNAADSILIRLQPGTDFGGYRAQLAKASGGSLVNFLDRRGQNANVQRSLHLQALAIWILGGLAALLIALVLAQTVARQVGLESADHPVLSALGMRPAEQIAAIAVRHGLTAAAGAVLACAVAGISSVWTPFGLARTAEASPGARIDVVVLAAGAFMLVAVVAGVAAAASAVTIRRRNLEEAGPSRVARAASRLRLPPATTAGLRFALEPGRGRSAVPVRTAMTGVAVAVVGLVATLTFAASLTHFLSNPSLYGVTWDLAIGANGGFDEPRRQQLLDVPGVRAASIGNLSLDILVNGKAVEGLAIGGDVEPPVTRGRMPRGENEIALGIHSLKDLGLRVGDTVRLAPEGAETVFTARVVGTALMASGRETTRIGEGAILPVELFLKVGRLLELQDFAPGNAFVRLDPGASREAVRNAITEKLAPGTTFDQNVYEAPVATPSDVVSFGRVRNLPLVFASALGVFSALTLAHTLITAIRRRRRDLAVLKTLGFVRGQVGRSILVQATAMTSIALLVSLPLGIAAGRWAWSALARDLGVINVPVVPVVAVLVTIPIALVLAAVVAAAPAAAASRTSPALVLRSE